MQKQLTKTVSTDLNKFYCYCKIYCYFTDCHIKFTTLQYCLSLSLILSFTHLNCYIYDNYHFLYIYKYHSIRYSISYS